MYALYEKALQETFAKLNIGDEEFKRRIFRVNYDCSEFRNSLLECFQCVIAERVEAGDCDASTGYSQAIQFCLRRHHKYVAANNNVCPKDELHQLLYVAAILAFVGNINGLVASTILSEILGCEGKFTSLLDFRISQINMPENYHVRRKRHLDFLNFLLTHCTLNKLDFSLKCGRRLRLGDSLIESGSPFSIISRLNMIFNPTRYYGRDICLLLLRHGLEMVDNSGRFWSIECFLQLLKDRDKPPSNIVNHRDVPSENMNTPSMVKGKLSVEIYPPSQKAQCVRLRRLREEMEEPEYGRFLEAHPSVHPCRCGQEPPELKHLARCKIRQALYKNWKLPFGIEELKVPESVKKYLNLGDVRV